MKTYGRSGLLKKYYIYTGYEGKIKEKEKNLTHGTNMKIWRGCCNQSLESSAFREGFPPMPNVKLTQIYVQTNFKIRGILNKKNNLI